jgi:hypothetical protein
MATTPAPRKRQPRAKTPTAGERLVEDLSRSDDPYSITVMVTEAGRIADRLDRLAALLSGERSAWMQVKLGREKQLEIKVDSALQEARAQATTLRGLLYEIHRERANITIGSDDDGDDLDDLI